MTEDQVEELLELLTIIAGSLALIASCVSVYAAFWLSSVWRHYWNLWNKRRVDTCRREP